MADDKLHAVVSCRASEPGTLWGSQMSRELNLKVPKDASEADVKEAVRQVLREHEDAFREDVREEHPGAKVSCVCQVSKDPITHPSQALNPQDMAKQRAAERERRIDEVMSRLDGASSREEALAIMKDILGK